MSSPEPVLRVRRLHPDRDADLPLPRYMTPGSAGMDVVAAVEGEVVLEPGERTLVPTGLALGVPSGFEVQVRPRSGLALKHGVTLANAPGTIDSDYRGELGVLLVNLGLEAYTVHRGDRVAQLVVAPVVQVRVESVDTLDETPRGRGGFGHTGRR
ncbi:MAG: dUTP diphosphatase [Myxococcota bacterium]